MQRNQVFHLLKEYPLKCKAVKTSNLEIFMHLRLSSAKKILDRPAKCEILRLPSSGRISQRKSPFFPVDLLENA